MLLLQPPLNYWEKIHSLISKFIRGGKRPWVSLTTLQCHKSSVSLSPISNIIYSFLLRPLSIWLNPDIVVSWKCIEEDLALPHRLADLVYSALPLKHAKLCLGPIITFLLYHVKQEANQKQPKSGT